MEISMSSRYDLPRLIAATTALTILAICACASQTQSRGSQTAAEVAINRARGILALAVQFRASSFEGPADAALAQELYRLELEKGREADWVACMLLPYYLGEANDGDLACNVGQRGRRVLPLLQKLLHEGPYDFGSNYAQELGKCDECWRRSVEGLMRSIDNGDKFECF